MQKQSRGDKIKRKLGLLKTCPACGWNMEASNDVVDKDAMNPGMAVLGAVGFGITGAVIGASMGKKHKRLVYHCSNILCGATYDMVEFDKWEKKARKKGLL